METKYEVVMLLTLKEHKELKEAHTFEQIAKIFNQAYQRGDFKECLKNI